ncbi:MAG: TIR domain-containing protein [Lachnospiraceae bacterium]|nr:TIR domain-containing protein [Lachnospiraceae bacterium]
MNLDYITRGNSEPEGKPKVYFSCHPEDFSEAFPLISSDLLKHANCAVWYDADAAGPDHCGKTYSMYAAAEKPEDLLPEMQLFVIAVTSKFLHEENRARDIELPLVLRNHIPVLPVMLENGLEYEFNEICGEIQVVSKYGKDPTAIPYDEVMQTFLDSVLVGNELAEQVRSAFDAYIFMSYRKKDRKHAQRLMRLIHENKLFRDIAIWYDEFLVPGEGFNKAIRDAFAKSSLFAMTVTPHLEEDGNYVMREEYPMARDRQEKDDKFEIIPVEMYGPEDRINGKDWRIDQSDLKDKDFKYKEIRDLKDEHRPAELNQSLINALTRIARKENDGSSYHKFFIGLAYLNGIDMEINRERALELITEAANEPSPCPEAAAKLADMYFYGEGVDPDPAQAVFWQKKLADLYKAAYDIHHDPDEHFGYGTEAFKALQKLSDMYKNFGEIQKAIKTAEQALSFSERLIPEVGIREQGRDSAVILNRLGNLYLEMEDQSATKDCFIKACKIYEKQASEIGSNRVLRDLSFSYERLGDICRREVTLMGRSLII